MKFNLLLERAYDSGIEFDKFATGHYAVVCYDETRRRYLLKRGIDEKKDQSYFLALLNQSQLERVVFPLGTYTKEKVKEIAKKLDLKAYYKKESQDFYSGDYEELLDSIPVSGNITDKDGNIIGKHKGVCQYTIGQRRGIGVSGRTPLYVTGIDGQTNTVIVGPDKDLYKKRLIVQNLNWIGIEPPGSPLHVRAKIRYLHKAQEAVVSGFDDDSAVVEFMESQRAITPGQYVVFYDNDTVLGAGVIEKAI
jgi:tRNA-specific 2-thiouridylase